MEKSVKEKNGIELRARARDHRCSDGTRGKAIAELERRRGNLRGAVIPQWEKDARGEKVDDWDALV
jgi:hypothetical protein